MKKSNIAMITTITVTTAAFALFCANMPQPIEEWQIMLATIVTAAVCIVTYVAFATIAQAIGRNAAAARAKKEKRQFWQNFVKDVKAAQPGRYVTDSNGHLVAIYKKP